MKLNLNTLLVFLLFHIPLSSQTIKGKVIDTETSKPLSFVNIGIKGTSYGTASNTSGDFVINVPERFKNSTLQFSCIGYETKSLSVREVLRQKEVRLQPSVIPLDEVTVMPDSTLRSFLRRAARKIPENYTSSASLLTGFYRQTLRDEQDENNLRFVEALLESYKTPYTDKKDGTVKMLKTRKYISGKDFFPAVFYGGAHVMHRDDMVKYRAKALTGHKNYDYQVLGVKPYNDRKVYEIAFFPAESSSSSIKGQFYLDVETLAYIQIDYVKTQKGLDKRTRTTSQRGMEAVHNEESVVYDELEGEYYLKSGYSLEVFLDSDSNRFSLESEYVTTHLSTDNVSNFSFDEQVSEAYIPSVEAEDYRFSDWKGYSLLALPETANLVDTLSGTRLLSSQAKIKEPFLMKMFSVLQKLEVSVGVGRMNVSAPGGNYSLVSNGVHFQKQRKAKDGASLLQTHFGYQLNRHFYLTYQVNETVDDDFYLKHYYLGGRYYFPLKTVGNQILLNLDGGFLWGNMGVSLGEEHSEESFTFGEKKIKADKVQAYTGIRQSGVKIGAGLTYQFSPRFHFEIGCNYLFPVVEKDIAILEEKSGFFLFRKKAFEELSHEDIDYRIDDISGNDSGMKFDGWTFQIGVKMMF